MFSIRSAFFYECYPLLQQLWPDAKIIYPIDNTAGLIQYLGHEYGKIRVQFFLAMQDDKPIGTIHIFNISDNVARIRGTWVCPPYRGHGIGKFLVQAALADFSDYKEFIGFAREGRMSFYEQLGFVAVEPIRKSIVYAYGYQMMRLSL